MRVSVTMTLDIDAEAWELNYGGSLGTENGVRRAHIRSDVKEHIPNMVHDWLKDLGLLEKEA